MKVKIKGASGGLAQRAAGGGVVRLRFQVGGCVRSGAPFAWHRRQPEFCREGNRRRLLLLVA